MNLEVLMRPWLPFVLILVAGSAHADAPPKIEEAISRAAAAGKPLIVEFYTDWCKPCKIFEAKILPDAKVQAALGEVVFVRYDAEADPGIAAAGRFNVNSFPTFLALDRSGAERKRLLGVETGEEGAAQFVAFVGDARASVQEEEGIKAQLAARPQDPAVRLAAARWYAGRDRDKDALPHYDAVAQSGTAKPAERAEAFGAAARIRRLDAWRRQLVAEKVEIVRRNPAAASPRDLAVATIGSGLPEREINVLFSSVFAASKDPEALNDLIYVALAAGARDEALAGAKKMVGLKKDAGLLDTLAECHHMRGERADALRVEDEALALAKDTPMAPSLANNRARFESGSGESDEVKQQRFAAAQLWKRMGKLEEPSRDDMAGAPGPMQGAMAFLMTSRKVGKEMGKTCQARAGKSRSAMAHLTLDADGKVTQSVLLLEEGAAPALRACLKKELAKVSLPKPPMGMKEHSLVIDFEKPKP